MSTKIKSGGLCWILNLLLQSQALNNTIMNVDQRPARICNAETWAGPK